MKRFYALIALGMASGNAMAVSDCDLEVGQINTSPRSSHSEESDKENKMYSIAQKPQSISTPSPVDQARISLQHAVVLQQQSQENLVVPIQDGKLKTRDMTEQMRTLLAQKIMDDKTKEKGLDKALLGQHENSFVQRIAVDLQYNPLESDLEKAFKAYWCHYAENAGKRTEVCDNGKKVATKSFKALESARKTIAIKFRRNEEKRQKKPMISLTQKKKTLPKKEFNRLASTKPKPIKIARKNALRAQVVSQKRMTAKRVNFSSDEVMVAARLVMLANGLYH